MLRLAEQALWLGRGVVLALVIGTTTLVLLDIRRREQMALDLLQLQQAAVQTQKLAVLAQREMLKAQDVQDKRLDVLERALLSGHKPVVVGALAWQRNRDRELRDRIETLERFLYSRR